MKPAKTTSAVVLVSSPEWAVQKDGVKKLQDAAVAQIAAVGEMENKAAMGAVLAGLTLHRVKASMPHGAFGKWLNAIGNGEKRTTGSFLKVGKRQAQFYMALALIFLEKSKVAKPDLLALPGDQTLLDLGDNHEARTFVQKLRAFVGDRSLNELLIKHDIKSVGLKKELAAEKATEEKPAEPPGVEELYEQSRDEIGGALDRLETLLLKENRLQYLAGKPDLLGVVESLEALAKKIRKAAAPLLENTKPAKGKS